MYVNKGTGRFPQKKNGGPSNFIKLKAVFVAGVSTQEPYTLEEIVSAYEVSLQTARNYMAQLVEIGVAQVWKDSAGGQGSKKQWISSDRILLPVSYQYGDKSYPSKAEFLRAVEEDKKQASGSNRSSR